MGAEPNGQRKIVWTSLREVSFAGIFKADS